MSQNVAQNAAIPVLTETWCFQNNPKVTIRLGYFCNLIFGLEFLKNHLIWWHSVWFSRLKPCTANEANKTYLRKVRIRSKILFSVFSSKSRILKEWLIPVTSPYIWIRDVRFRFVCFLNGPILAYFLYFRLFNTVDSKHWI